MQFRNSRETQSKPVRWHRYELHIRDGKTRTFDPCELQNAPSPDAGIFTSYTQTVSAHSNNPDKDIKPLSFA